MKAGILAAGRGERLARAGVVTPKPLVPVGGEPLIARAIRAARGAGATAVACVVNEEHAAVADYVRGETWPIPVELVVRSTPSSMESLFALAPLLAGEPFLLLTVDALFGPGVLRDFVARALALARADAAGVLALTEHVDDEKPLWARLDADGRVVRLGAAAVPTPYVTAGFYFFHPRIFALVDAARRQGLTALRGFLALLIDAGHPLYGVPGPQTLDLDRPEDLAAAERFLAALPTPAPEERP